MGVRSVCWLRKSETAGRRNPVDWGGRRTSRCWARRSFVGSVWNLSTIGTLETLPFREMAGQTDCSRCVVSSSFAALCVPFRA